MTEKNQKEIKVTKLEIQLSDDKVTLSVADAKKLYEELQALFASKTVVTYHDYWLYHPYWYQQYNPLQGAIYCASQQNLQGGLSQNNFQSASPSVQGSTLQMSVNS